MSPTPQSHRLSRLQIMVLMWLYREAGAAAEPIAWRHPAWLTPASWQSLSRCLLRLERRSLIRRLDGSLTAPCKRAAYVEITDAGTEISQRLITRRHPPFDLRPLC